MGSSGPPPRRWLIGTARAPEMAPNFAAPKQFIICGTGEYLKTVLKKGLKPFGTAL